MTHPQHHRGRPESLWAILFSGGPLRPLLTLLLALVLVHPLGLARAQAPASAPGAAAPFDHLATGFPLLDAHARATCESCHQGGVLRGTPRDCVSCHAPGRRLSGGNTVMPPNHLPTQQACDSCHNTASFVGARFRHIGVVPGTCQTCHNGAVTEGKTANHIPTTASCDTCHRSSAWLPARGFDHVGVVPGTCQTCHNGSRATGKNAQHMPTGIASSCDSCHSSTRRWVPTAWNHTQTVVAAQCASCHSGAFPPADGKPAAHVPYAAVPVTAAANCDGCHKAGFAQWSGGRVHANFTISGGCSTCHTGAYPGAVGKPTDALHAGVTGNCESCHKSTSSWGSAQVNHASFNAATNCAGCHNGSTATGKSATHIPSGAASCFSCHGTTSWTPGKWNHTQVPVTAQCSSCHSGAFPPADGKPATHVPYAAVPVTAAANCDGCHKAGFTSWTGARVHASFSISTNCSTCHTGAYPGAVGKPTDALHAGVTGNCESCHKSTSSWGAAQVDHSRFNAATNCAGCHNGSAATGKSATHIPSGAASCFSCHGTTSWTPSKWNHTQVPVTAQCSSCHSGAFPPADGKPAAHVPYAAVPVTAAANCDGCHKAGFTSWTGARVHASFSISTNCSTCHTGAYPGAVGKPTDATHAAVTGNCESCHKSTSSWNQAKVDHSGFNAATNCTGCHNGSAATGKPATHIPTGAASCFSCHGTVNWTPTKWNHTQVPVTAQCSSCHSGAFPPADGKPATHLPYAAVPVTAAANCDGCHKAGYSSWTGARVHANFSISTHCSTCHSGAYPDATGKPSDALHAGVTGNCESCHKSTSNWSSAQVDHSGFNAATNCTTCHNGSVATGKPGTHIPTGAASCFSCHGTASWTPTKWNHTQVPVTAQCSSCHSGAFPPADGKPAAHVPYTAVPVTAAANCDGCHKAGYSSWTGARVHANFSISTSCSTCHTGAYPGAVGKPNNAVHAAITGSCESCHKSTSSWSVVNFSHSPANAVGTGTCDTCHNGGTATGKPPNHIPVPAGSARCDSCHRSQTSWTASVAMNHGVVATATCKSCHGGSFTAAGATAKPANHIPEVQLLAGASMDCKACHTSTSSWGAMRMDHNNSQGNGAGWCKACHDRSTSWLGDMEKKSLTHERSSGVTDCSQSGCHRPLGNKGSPYTRWE